MLTDQEIYYDRRFEDVTLKDDVVEFKEFEDCVFTGCAFHQTMFRGCRFLNCVFTTCEFQLVQVRDCAFTDVKFDECKMIGINWTEASWPRRGLLKPLRFTGCVLNHSTFIGLSLKKMTLTDCIARDVDFSETDLSQADCRRTDFAQSRFMQTNLTKTDFRGARQYTIDPRSNTLKDTKFSLPEAMALLYSLDIILDQ